MRAAPLVLALILLLTGCSALRPWTAPGPGDSVSQLDYITRPAVTRVGCSVTVDWRLSASLLSRLRLDTPEISVDLGTVAGSGFVVANDGYVATNAHVVWGCHLTDAETLEKAWPKVLGQIGEKVGRLVTREEVIGGITPAVRRDLRVILPGGHPYSATIAAIGQPVSEQGRDVAILKIPANNLPSLLLFDSRQVSPPRTVFAVGYPLAGNPDLLDPTSQDKPTYTQGIISAVKQTRQGVPVLQVSAQATYGNSGGPVVLDNGAVVGIMTLGTQDYESFNFVFTSNTVLDFVADAKASNVQGQVDRDYQSALRAMAAHDYAQAVPLLQNVLRLYPDHATAGELLAQAQANAVAAPAHGPALYLWAGAGLLAFALLGTVAMLVLGRRQRPAWVAAGPRLGRGRPRPADDVEATQEIVGPPGALVGNAVLDHRRFPLTPGGLMVGRDRGCEVVVNDPRVSKRHVWVGAAAHGRGVEVIDQGSRNGTYLVRHGGRPVRIDRAHLLPGDVIWLVPDGSLALTYEV